VKRNGRSHGTWCAAALSLALIAASADGAVITKWAFETYTPPDSTAATSGPHAADVGTGQALGVHASAATAWSTPVGNGSANSFSSNTWAVGDFYQFQTSTTGFNGITLLFDQTRSSTGPSDFKVRYSTDGTNFIDAPGAAYTVTPLTFTSLTEQTTSPPRFGFDFSSITALDNQPSVTFQMVSTSAPGAPAGTNRIDNVTIGTDPVPEPAGVGLLALAAAGAVGRRRR
jgi:hypothetical protein